MSDAGLEYVPFPAEEVRSMPDGSVAAMREPLPGHEAYIDVIPPADAEDPRVQRRSVRHDDGLTPSAEPAPRTPEEQLLLELTEFNRNGCATDLRALHRMVRTDHEPDAIRARAMALRSVEIGLRRGLLTSGMFVRVASELAFVEPERSAADRIATVRERYVSAPQAGESDGDLANSVWLMNTTDGERYARTHSADQARDDRASDAGPATTPSVPAVVVRSSSDEWGDKNHELLADNVFEELRNGWLSWDKDIGDDALKNLAWGIAAEIVYAFDVKWSPDWVAKGHPHRWHDVDGWHTRCNDCLDESPAEADEAVAYSWFADHRPVAHGDTAPPFRPSPPPLDVPMPGTD
ncbi:hypothetical protein [Curtobacterium flaccumfaciens]|uniref:hypothetical protein n=1 Tax=Curtobacterium flaccumfaciens TaxID=2035 RepID=UPI001BDE5EB0|nr:hypothetical protein [Curtobacterium flaccumfaciens]MBT1608151.1 hypothetical protein [Curtobacterium flaccumfaciens pv. betae]MBT1657342.1 hypothetical protein [Curtobacterium flaccumfaciens pv. betae]MCS0471152.1 hypothetical protein [Curtobacterium flaccumfaciens pv. betae]MCS0474409.1 hypothetical protein [Curtobacterium flaccumfaciens pv. betae]MCS0477718.1 hypothetical protein [Curtobacterium flaccumfaciens pv. betae]